MYPNIDGRTDVSDVNVDTPCKPAVQSASYQKAESIFLSKNSSLRTLIVLSVGLKNVKGDDLIDLEVNP
jgi:hypothetical protein